MLFGHDQLDLVLGPDRHLQAAEVRPLLRRESLPRVPGAALRLHGCSSLPLRLLERLAVIELVAGQLLIAVTGPLSTRVC